MGKIMKNEVYTDLEQEHMESKQINTEQFFDAIMAICKDYEDKHLEPSRIKRLEDALKDIRQILMTQGIVQKRVVLNVIRQALS